MGQTSTAGAFSAEDSALTVTSHHQYMEMKLLKIIRDTTLYAKYTRRVGCVFDEGKHTRCKRWVLFREKMSHPVLLKKKEGKHRSRLHG